GCRLPAPKIRQRRRSNRQGLLATIAADWLASARVGVLASPPGTLLPVARLVSAAARDSGRASAGSRLRCVWHRFGDCAGVMETCLAAGLLLHPDNIGDVLGCGHRNHRTRLAGPCRASGAVQKGFVLRRRVVMDD